jgi:hypothetical protein
MARSSIRPDQRARLGLTGLALVFLLVLVAAAVMRPGSTIGPPMLTPQGEASENAGKEPLAMLGVAPASRPDVSASQ